MTEQVTCVVHRNSINNITEQETCVVHSNSVSNMTEQVTCVVHRNSINNITEQETCVVHRNTVNNVTHCIKFTGDRHQMFYCCNISCIAMLMVPYLYNQAVLCTAGSSCFWQRIIPTDFEVLGHLCGCWQYTNVHLCCSVMGQLTEDNNIYCKTKVILTTYSCWWWPSLAKTRRMNVKLIWTSSHRCAN